MFRDQTPTSAPLMAWVLERWFGSGNGPCVGCPPLLESDQTEPALGLGGLDPGQWGSPWLCAVLVDGMFPHQCGPMSWGLWVICIWAGLLHTVSGNQMKMSPHQGRHLLAVAKRRPVVWDT